MLTRLTGQSVRFYPLSVGLDVLKALKLPKFILSPTNFDTLALLG